jgi:translation initiation factor IF-3
LKNFKKDPFVVDRITFRKTKLIDHEEKYYEAYNVEDALKLSKKYGLQLVCFKLTPRYSKELPLCKIIDYGKWKYNQDKANKKNLSNTKHHIKEIRFTPVIDDHDVEHKVNQAIEFLKNGDELILSMRLKGRQKQFFKDAEERINKIVSLCGEYGKEISRKSSSGNITVRLNKKVKGEK